MAGMISISRTNLTQRRKRLRRRRQMKIIQTIWRTIAVTGLCGGLLWVTIQPMWVLETPKQIVVKSGDRLLSNQAIGSMLGLSYPQSLWRIEPSRIANTLKKQPNIAEALVSRRLFPPGLIIQIQERVPVAITQTSKQQNSDTSSKKESVQLLDITGVLIPVEKYTSLNPNSQLPNLKVIGTPEQYRSYWTQLYQAVSQSSVKITEIDCQDPTNLILKTELGNVHLGAPTSQLPEQLKALSQMSHLPTQLNPNGIEYIDLKNPDSPLVQMNQIKQK
jgi:cell division protein FtsQ